MPVAFGERPSFWMWWGAAQDVGLDERRAVLDLAGDESREAADHRRLLTRSGGISQAHSVGTAMGTAWVRH
jgi:hypothetical protein